MPAFVAALVVAPSLSSSTLGSSSLFSPFDGRRKSISGGLAQPFRESSSPPPLLQLSSSTSLSPPSPLHGFGSRPSSPGRRKGGGGRRSSTRPKTSESLKEAAAALLSFPPSDGHSASRIENGSRSNYSENLVNLLRAAGVPGEEFAIYLFPPFFRSLARVADCPSLSTKGDRPKPFIYPIVLRSCSKLRPSLALLQESGKN